MAKIFIAFAVLALLSLVGCSKDATADSTNPDDLERVTQTLVMPPFLPEHDQVAVGDPKVVQVRLVIEEKLIEIDPSGTKIWALTFNGSVPAPIIVVHQNDYVELTLVNPATNSLQHNIDLHAATGAMGGGELSIVNPGEEVVFRFKATKQGVFVYHCAPGGVMIPLHVVSGMNGAIMVLPRDGLKDAEGDLVEYDKAYFIGEQDYYIPKDEDGEYKFRVSCSERNLSISGVDCPRSRTKFLSVFDSSTMDDLVLDGRREHILQKRMEVQAQTFQRRRLYNQQLREFAESAPNLH
jgi:FtsP/CotA-like multicopper oxidase with cupredoxin domain